ALSNSPKTLRGVLEIRNARRVARRSDDDLLIGKNWAWPQTQAIHHERLQVNVPIMRDEQIHLAVSCLKNRVWPCVQFDPKPRLRLEVRQDVVQESAFCRCVDDCKPDNVALCTCLLCCEASRPVKQEHQEGYLNYWFSLR